MANFYKKKCLIHFACARTFYPKRKKNPQSFKSGRFLFIQRAWSGNKNDKLETSWMLIIVEKNLLILNIIWFNLLFHDKKKKWFNFNKNFNNIFVFMCLDRKKKFKNFFFLVSLCSFLIYFHQKKKYKFNCNHKWNVTKTTTIRVWSLWNFVDMQNIYTTMTKKKIICFITKQNKIQTIRQKKKFHNKTKLLNE